MLLLQPMKPTLNELLNKARELYEQDKNTEAATLAREILHLAQSQNEYAAQAHALNTLGTTFFNQNLYEEALENYLQAEKLIEEYVGKQQTVPSLINIAIIYNRQQLFEQAIQTYQRALSFLQDENTSMLHAQIHNGLGNVFSEWGKPREAFEHFKQVVQISKTLAIPYGEALGLSNLACVAIKLKDAIQAQNYARQTLVISANSNFEILSLVAETVLADALFLQHHWQEGIDKYQTLIPQIEAAHRDDMLQDAFTQIQHAYVQLADFKAAYETGLKLAEVNARLLSIERTKVINAMQVRFETEKKESALRQLHMQSEKLQRRKVEAELESLRSRMNPHFVYNVMNTIQGLVRLNKTEEAIAAIERFALLNRLTLEHSGVNEVTVAQEVQLLINYIETEKLLIGNNFSYQITVDENIETDFTFLPSLLVQPFVENAIKHGLMHSKHEQNLFILFNRGNSLLKVLVRDNGIGRGASGTVNHTIRNKPQSFATAAIASRIALLNETRVKPIEIFTIDLFDNLQQPAGTEIVILVPLQD